MILRYNASDKNYEDFKRKLQKQSLTPEEYQRAIIQYLIDYSKFSAGKPKRAVVKIDIRTNKILQEFNSVSEATKHLGYVSKSNISSCCKGNKKSVGGYLWKYKEEVV